MTPQKLLMNNTHKLLDTSPPRHSLHRGGASKEVKILTILSKPHHKDHRLFKAMERRAQINKPCVQPWVDATSLQPGTCPGFVAARTKRLPIFFHELECNWPACPGFVVFVVLSTAFNMFQHPRHHQHSFQQRSLRGFILEMPTT
jgi:hypothetical protein